MQAMEVTDFADIVAAASDPAPTKSDASIGELIETLLSHVPSLNGVQGFVPQLWHALFADADLENTDGAVLEFLRAGARESAALDAYTLASLDPLLAGFHSNPTFWPAMTAAGMPPKLLAAVLVLAFREAASASNVTLCMLAVAGYFRLLAIADADAFGVFHSFPARDMLNRLRNVLLAGSLTAAVGAAPGESRKRKAPSPADKRAAKRRTSAAGAAASAPTDESDGSDGDGEAEQTAAAQTAGASAADTAAAAGAAAAAVAATLGAFPLHKTPDTTAHAVAVAVALSRGAAAAATTGYSWLQALLQAPVASFGPAARSETLGLVLKSLVPSFLLPVEGAGAVAFVLRLHAASQPAAPGPRPLAAALGEALHALLQHVIMAADDRAAARDAAVGSVLALLPALPAEQWLRFSGFVGRLSRNAKVGHRMAAIEAAAAMATAVRGMRPADVSASVAANGAKTLLGRAADKSPKVRAKALALLGDLVAAAEAAQGSHADWATAVLRVLGLGPAGGDAAVLGWVLETLQRRLADDKAAVRRCALQLCCVLAQLALGDAGPRDDATLGMLRGCLGLGCQDESVLVRKAAVEALTAVLRATAAQTGPAALALRATWAEAVLPLLVDAEATVADKAAEALRVLALEPLASGSSESGLALAVLDSMGPATRRYLDCYFARAEHSGAVDRRLPPALQGAIARAEAEGVFASAAWAVLGVAAPYAAAAVSETAVAQSWAKVAAAAAAGEGLGLSTVEQTDAARALVLPVLAVAAPRLPAPAASRLGAQLTAQMLSFADPPAVAAPLIETLVQLGAAAGPWLAQLWAAVDERLAAAVHSGALAAADGEMARLLFALGETASLQGEAGRGPVPSRALASVQMLASGPESLAVPPRTRAHAVLALGKLCLASEALARECMACFGRELTESPDAAVRSNVLVVLADLCMRYTALVDRYVPAMALLLADPVPAVRSNALTLLTRLLQEDFLKWRGPLVHRFIFALADPAPEVAAHARFCLLRLLTGRYPHLLAGAFVEALFVLSGCTDHPAFNAAPQTQIERERFSLAGPANTPRRLAAMRAVLGALSDEERFALSARLCSDVLGAVVDGAVPAPDQSPALAAVLGDTLALLACPEIKIGGGRPADGDDAAAGAELEQAKARLLSRIVRKNTIENILPVAIALKRMLEHARSPLLRELMLFVRELTRDHRAEIADILVGDRQLAAELEYDLRKLDEADAAAPAARDRAAAVAAAAAAVAAAAGGPAQFISPLRTARSMAAAPTPVPTLRKAAMLSAAAAMAAADQPLSTPLRRAVSSPAAAGLTASHRSSHAAAAAAAGGVPMVVHLPSPLAPARPWNVTPRAEPAAAAAAAADGLDAVRLELNFEL